MPRIEHLALYGADALALKEFYVQAFGLRVVLDNSQGDPPGFFLADDRGLALEIIGRHPDQAPASTRHVCHVAFWVDDFPAARAALERLGVRFEPDTEVDSPALRTAFFPDPEGNRCQIVWRSRPLGG
jgi:glyoxylase I family protein